MLVARIGEHARGFPIIGCWQRWTGSEGAWKAPFKGKPCLFVEGKGGKRRVEEKLPFIGHCTHMKIAVPSATSGLASFKARAFKVQRHVSQKGEAARSSVVVYCTNSVRPR